MLGSEGQGEGIGYQIDIDNVLKACCDSCNPKRSAAFIWKDDRQVDEASIKRMGIDKMRPRMTMEVEVL
jgi:Holliday junction resolvase RusA-like endonuclease